MPGDVPVPPGAFFRFRARRSRRSARGHRGRTDPRRLGYISQYCDKDMCHGRLDGVPMVLREASGPCGVPGDPRIGADIEQARAGRYARRKPAPSARLSADPIKRSARAAPRVSR